MRDVRRVAACTAVGMVLAVLRLGSLAAQTIATRIVTADQSLPVPGAMVILTDSSGHELGRALTDEAGRVFISVGAPGTYRIVVLRIGFTRWESPPVRLAAAETYDRPIAVPQQPILLPELTVRSERRCRVLPEEGSLAATLWDEARKALEVTEYTFTHHLYRFHTSHYVRTYDETETRVTADSQLGEENLTSSLWTSLPAESLDARGYVQHDDEGVSHYYGPDLPVLFSDLFLRRHCLRVLAGPAGQQDSIIGVGFEPASRRRIVDISGVLWLHSSSKQLRRLEFKYVNLGFWSAHGGRGMIEFDHLPSGAWVIRRWFIRAPQARIGSKPSSYPGVVSPGTDTLGIAGYQEEGALVLEVLSATGRLVVSYPRD